MHDWNNAWLLINVGIPKIYRIKIKEYEKIKDTLTSSRNYKTGSVETIFKSTEIRYGHWKCWNDVGHGRDEFGQNTEEGSSNLILFIAI